MKLVRKNIPDGFRWRCSSYQCNKNEISIRKNSIFTGLKIPLDKTIFIIYEWSKDTKLKDIKRELNVDYRTINGVLNIIRKKLMKLKKEKIQGKNKHVEIDESAVTKQKFEKGRKVASLWCVGGICRETSEVFFELTEPRTKDVLQKIVEKM